MTEARAHQFREAKPPPPRSPTAPRTRTRSWSRCSTARAWSVAPSTPSSRCSRAPGSRYELILVNDGSRDGSWEVISERARAAAHIVALNLLQNYGQHHANLAGLREATGDYVITMDDDLQNPPDQALLLIDEAMDGCDVVFGRFERKQAAGYRKLGSKLISMINRRVFAPAARARRLQLPHPAP